MGTQIDSGGGGQIAAAAPGECGNWLNHIIRALDKVGILSRWTNVIGIVLLFAMIILNVIDVVMDSEWINSPLLGVTGLTEVLMICGIFLAMAHAQNESGHLAVDIISSKLSRVNQLSLNFVNSILSIGIFSIVFWRVVDQTIYFIQKGVVHEQYMHIPKAPFAAVIAFGVICMTLLLFRDFLKIIVEGINRKFSLIRWSIMIAVPIILGALIGLFMLADIWQFSLTIVALIGCAFFVVLLLSGLPIAFTMLLTALVFVAHIRGPITALDMIGRDVYTTSGSYTFAVLPFFMMMGFFCLHARFGDDLYEAAYKWLGHLRGGLGYATILACTFFAAIVGDPIASVSTMGPAALPQMRKYGYDDKLSTGSIVAGSQLGPIIPPSSAMIVVGLLTGVPIGWLLVAGILPGILLALVFIIVIFIWCRLRPKAAPTGEKTAWIPRLISLKAGGPVLVIFLVCIGGIYMGYFTPTRGGAVGAFSAVILGLIMGRWRWKNFKQALLDGGKNVSMVFLILISALLFTRFLAWCNVTETISDFVINLGMSPTVFVILTLVFFFVVGIPIDILPMILIGFPIFFPISQALGIDPVWFCLMLVIVTGMGELTPPVGITMFVLRGMARDIPMGTIFKGVLPFLGAAIVAIIILFLVPSITTWLPSLK
jgi:tripartite ATP-independent transporter DctM subunit